MGLLTPVGLPVRLGLPAGLPIRLLLGTAAGWHGEVAVGGRHDPVLEPDSDVLDEHIGGEEGLDVVDAVAAGAVEGEAHGAPVGVLLAPDSAVARRVVAHAAGGLVHLFKNETS